MHRVSRRCPISSLDPPVGLYDHTLGPPGAQLTLVEYGDYECPYCRAAVPVIGQVREQLGDRMRFVFRHFPLHELHPHALAAALAAEMAALEGRFWQMHDSMFAPGPPRLTQADLAGHAEAAGVRPERVLWPATRTVEDRVEAGFNAAVRSGVRGTPTLFVNGEQYRGEIAVGDLAVALERGPVGS